MLKAPQALWLTLQTILRFAERKQRLLAGSQRIVSHLMRFLNHGLKTPVLFYRLNLRII